MGERTILTLREGTVIAGKYRLERPLASGGMGTVWIARHLDLDELMAMKFMDPSLVGIAEARQRFEREAKSAARIRSPHVVQILDHGVDRDVPYLVMELLEGEDLGERVRRVGRLSLAVTATICQQVVKALTRAHRAGIVHRDLKPANIFLARVDDEEEMVKVLDFGVVKAIGTWPDAPGTKSGVLIGSPNYMSPEQARGAKNVDHHTDLWSLALVLFEAITGRMAFTGDSLVEVAVNICTGPIPVPSEVEPDLPEELDAFFRHALKRDPTRRFASARDMGAAFTALVKKLGPRAYDVGPPRESSIHPAAIVPNPSDIPAEAIGAAGRGAPRDGGPVWRKLLQGTAEISTIPRPSLQDTTQSTALPSTKQSPNVTPPPRPSTRGTKGSRIKTSPSGTMPAALKPQDAPPPPRASRRGAQAAPQPSPTQYAAEVSKFIDRAFSDLTIATPPPPGPPPGDANATRGSARAMTPPPPARQGLKELLSGGSAPSVAATQRTLNPSEAVTRVDIPSAASHSPTPARSGTGAKKAEPAARERPSSTPPEANSLRMLLSSSDVPPPPPQEPRRKSGTSLKDLLMQDHTPAGGTPSAGNLKALFTPEPTPSGGTPSVGGLRALFAPDPTPPARPALPPPPPPPPPPPELENTRERSIFARLTESHGPPTNTDKRIAALVDQGFTALRSGDREKARQLWQEALRLEPSNRALELNLRKLDRKKGER